jgi:TPR repeat protein
MSAYQPLFFTEKEIGSDAHYRIGISYFERTGVEKDTKKVIRHFEIAAMAGHERARYYLGYIEADSGNMERAIKYWTFSASAGQKESMMMIKESFEKGLVQTDAYELMLKAYNHSCEEMRSKARDDAAYFEENGVRSGQVFSDYCPDECDSPNIAQRANCQP